MVFDLKGRCLERILKTEGLNAGVVVLTIGRAITARWCGIAQSEKCPSMMSHCITDIIKIFCVCQGARMSMLNRNHLMIIGLPFTVRKNSGVGSSRNYGIDKAKYDYITFIGADDEWLSDFLESITYPINKYPNCGIYATARHEDNKGLKKTIKSKYKRETDFLIADYCREAHIIQSSTMCVTEKCISKVGTYSKETIGEDTDFKLRIACHCNVDYLNSL